MGEPSGKVKSQDVQVSVSMNFTACQVRAPYVSAKYRLSGDHRTDWVTQPCSSHSTSPVSRFTN